LQHILLYLIRPDGYIGFRCQPVAEEQLIGYLRKFFSLVSGARKA